jgi:hypothetical protein
MEYKDFTDKVGMRFDIVEGELQESPSGLFTVSETYRPFSIYLNKQTKQAMIIAPESSYLGRSYGLKKRDCITLFAQWLDEHFNSSFGNIYQKLSHRDFMKYYKGGMSLWYEDNNFQKIESSLIEGDCIVYAYRPAVISHVGIYLNESKILHHLPEKLSCIDQLDTSKILGVYRYAQ